MNKELKTSRSAANEIADQFKPGFFDDGMISDIAQIIERHWQGSALKAQPVGAALEAERVAFEAAYIEVRGCLSADVLVQLRRGDDYADTDGERLNIAWRVWQQARAQLAAPAGVPDGYVLAPQEIHLSASDIELINGMCGDGNDEGGYGPYQDGTLYIGYAERDDGSKVYGLHISCDECPEEGVTTLAEFAAAPSPAPASGSAVLRGHQIAAFVNELRDCAVQYAATQQLRARISEIVIRHQPTSDVVQVPRELLERLIVSNSPYQFDPKTYWPAHKEASALLNGGH